MPELATCEDGERLTAAADVTWKARRSKYLKIQLYKATFWPINHPPRSSWCCCCELCCLLFLLLSRGAIQSSALSDGVFPFSPAPGVLFCVFIYLLGVFSFSQQRGMGSDLCSKRGPILLAASPVPLSPLLMQKAFTISAADFGAAKGTSPGPEAGALLPCAAFQPCLDSLGDGAEEHCWRGALGPTFVVTHPMMFWDQAGSKAQQSLDSCGCLPAASDVFCEVLNWEPSLLGWKGRDPTSPLAPEYIRFPELLLDSFTQRGAASGLRFPSLCCPSARVPWSQALTCLLTWAALLLNEQKKNK